jgi:NAD(P)-dependent dehydrogenase (short-subunit alcohol dehydrogenase family)
MTAADPPLQDARVLVTGGAKGIGAAISERLAAAGADLVVSGRNAAELDAYAAELSGRSGRRVLGVAADLAEPEAPELLADAAWTALGGLDVLVNNAGMSITGPAAQLRPADWDAVLAVNLRAPALLAARLGARMADAGGGRIITIASAAGLRALPEHYSYCASKAALIMATRVLALELGPRGVRANSICPTVVLTEMGIQVWGEQAKSAPMLARIPAGHFAQPVDVAEAVLYLASPAAEMINGTELVLDGGYLAT